MKKNDNIMNHICYLPYWEKCWDPFLARDILEFLEYSEKYTDRVNTTERIYKAMLDSCMDCTLDDVKRTLRELEEIHRVYRENGAWRI